MQASVYQRTQFEPDAIWHLAPVQLPSHNVRNGRTIRELQNKSGGRCEGQTVTSRGGTSDQQRESVTVVDSSVDQSPNQRVCSICRQRTSDDA